MEKSFQNLIPSGMIWRFKLWPMFSDGILDEWIGSKTQGL